MKQRDIPQGENMTDEALEQWAQAFGYVATRYRVACSPGSLVAGAPWLKGKPMVPALTQLAREAGLTFQLLTANQHSINSWRLPVVVELNDGKIGVIDNFDGEDTLEVSFFDDNTHTNRLSMSAMLPAIRHVIALRPLAALKDSRVDAYISKYRPDWLYRLVMRDLRPYSWVMLAALFINVLSLSGIVFSMQVYDRVIPAQSYPTLYVLTIGVLIATLFGFVLRVARGHIMDLLGKRSDLRVSDRVFGHALHRQLYLPAARAGADPRDGHLLHHLHHRRSAVLYPVCDCAGDHRPAAGVDRPGGGGDHGPAWPAAAKEAGGAGEAVSA